MSNPTPRRDPGGLVAGLVSALLVIIAAVGGAIVTSSVKGELPAEVATHWGPSGKPDGFELVGHAINIGLVLSLVIPLFLVVLGLVMKQSRTLGPIAAGTGVFMAVLIYGTIWAQRGMSAEQVREASSADIWLLIGGVAGLVIGVLGMIVFRRKPSEQPVPVEVVATAPRLLVDDSVTLAWTGRTSVATPVLALLGASAALTLGIGVWMAIAGSWGGALMMLGTVVLLVLVGAAMATQVTIDHRGVRARTLGLFNVINIPLQAIAGASVKNISPLGDFGGWGLRVGFNGEMGLVTSNGPALRIDRGEVEGPCLITLADAESAAATLNTLVARRAE